MIEIDGTMGEGGGQVLRSSLSLSLITGLPVHIRNIRAARAKPGLGFQHCIAVQAAARIGRAQVDGVRVGSREIVFTPEVITPGDYHFDIGTAGAVSLVLQTVLLPLMATGVATDAPSRIAVSGGTHVPWSPCFHYLDWHWRKVLARMGANFELHMERAGFYPEGGGRVQARIPCRARLCGLHLEARGQLRRLCGVSAVANLPVEIAVRQRNRALRRLREWNPEADIALEQLAAHSRGTAVVLLAEFEHSQACFSALGARGKPAERVADEAVDELEKFLSSDAAIDRWAADQLLLPMAMAKQPSTLRTAEVTRHLLTNAEVIRRFLPVRIDIDADPGGPGTVCVVPAEHDRDHRSAAASSVR